MPEDRLNFSINTRFATVLFLVLLLHAILFVIPKVTLPDFLSMERTEKNHEAPLSFQLKEIRTIGQKDGSKQNNVLVTPKEVASKSQGKSQLNPFDMAKMMAQRTVNKAHTNPKKPEAPKPAPVPQEKSQSLANTQAPPVATRPGDIPIIRPVGMQQITQTTVQNRSVREYVEESGSSRANDVIASPTLSRSDFDVKVDVPEGVEQGELNQFELKFYAFQKRIMTKYIESIILEVREFEKKYPNRSFIPEGVHNMTGRVTFDTDGNIKQIKMVRWTNAANLQDMFEEALKSMHSLPNPPKLLWEKDGEFTVFYNLTVNNL